MPRSGLAARQRLQQAALELYQEHGFDRATTVQIAERAGVSERTFFHHFRDKREVLFAGQERVRGLLLAAVRAAPGELAPLDALLTAFQSLDDVMEESRSYLQARHELIITTPALRERETAKLASLADTLAEALHERGTPPQQAALAAHSAMAAFNIAVAAWHATQAEKLSVRLESTFEDLRGVCAR